MDDSEVLHLQPVLRGLQPTTLQSIAQPNAQLQQQLQSLAPGLPGLDGPAVDPHVFQQRFPLDATTALHAAVNPFGQGGIQTLQAQQSIAPVGYSNTSNGNAFGIVAAPPPPPPPVGHIGASQGISRGHQVTEPNQVINNAFGRSRNQSADTGLKTDGQFEGLKLIPDPPNLQEWREKMFHVEDTIVLTEDEFQIYFPHIDNVYSHRSTQRHKRKRFVSHYWDCRLKGRPPGTKKSTDPDKKKRKRVARERDLCDVKIKITEFSDPSEFVEQMGQQPPAQSASNNLFLDPVQGAATQSLGPWGLMPVDANPSSNISVHPPKPARKIYTMQRVNGNGGNGKSDGVAGPHKHTLEESDRVKKNSVIRWMMKNDKDHRKKTGQTYHKKATGDALLTVKNHSKEEDLKLYGSCFCPFVQRVWISLEMKGIPYQYIEVDPYKKPQSLLDVNPRGLVPAIRHGPTWSTHESTVIMEYLEDLQHGPALLPSNPQTRATCRLWTDHINRHIVPSFYHLLQAQDADDQVKNAETLRNEIAKLVDAANMEGPFFLGPTMTFVDVQIAPWIVRLKRVLGPYRGWPEPERESRWGRWVEAIEGERSVRMTTSDDGLYLDSYERYAENRPNTSQLADAVNSGRGLP